MDKGEKIMSFMKEQIIQDRAWQIETNHGTEIVPFHVCSMFDVEQLQEYCEGTILGANRADYQIQKLPLGYVYRLSAPGYLDCTSWGYASTKALATIHLRDLYGDDNNASE
jgi:hypothetical protein